MKTDRVASGSHVRELLLSIGHHTLWVLIAILFCCVEAAVFVTELRPFKRVRRRLPVPALISTVHPTPLESRA